MGRLKGIIFNNTDFVAKKSTTPLYFLEDLFTTSNNLISFKAGLICAGFYLEFIVWRRSLQSSWGDQGQAPPLKFLEMNMPWDAVWCILRHNFEKCHSVRTDLVVSAWFFWYSCLYTVTITIFFFGVGGKLLPLKYPRQNLFVGFTCIIAFQIILQQCCKTSCTFLLPVLRSLNHYSYKELVQVNDFNY